MKSKEYKRARIVDLDRYIDFATQVLLNLGIKPAPAKSTGDEAVDAVMFGRGPKQARGIIPYTPAERKGIMVQHK